MSEDTARRLVILIAILTGMWFLFTKANFTLHTGGDETETYTSNRTHASAWTLIGDASVTIDQGDGALGEKKTITCPNCGEQIIVEGK
ncbi:MAG: hypothetical protein FWC60_08635 [Firmicutes bacterium]|nr:hypothetical protein [Bacillota bacterium]